MGKKTCEDSRKIFFEDTSGRVPKRFYRRAVFAGQEQLSPIFPLLLTFSVNRAYKKIN